MNDCVTNVATELDSRNKPTYVDEDLTEYLKVQMDRNGLNKHTRMGTSKKSPFEYVPKGM